MQLGRHEHVVELIGVCVAEQPLLLLVEYMANGNLRDYLRKFRQNPEKMDKVFFPCSWLEMTV